MFKFDSSYWVTKFWDMLLGMWIVEIGSNHVHQLEQQPLHINPDADWYKLQPIYNHLIHRLSLVASLWCIYVRLNIRRQTTANERTVCLQQWPRPYFSLFSFARETLEFSYLLNVIVRLIESMCVRSHFVQDGQSSVRIDKIVSINRPSWRECNCRTVWN